MIYKSSPGGWNPREIAEIPVGGRGGLIGITFAPGKKQPRIISGARRRDLHVDLDRIALWRAAAVVTLIEEQEMDALGLRDLGQEVRARKMAWHHWPIRDYGVPDETFEAAWPKRSAGLHAILAAGGRILIHCKGGLGRSGTIAARLLVESGVAADRAMRIVRAARSGAIETHAQERWLALGHAALPG